MPGTAPRTERSQAPALNGVLSWEGRGREWTAVASGSIDALTLAASAIGAEVVGQRVLSLDEIFLAQVGGGHSVPVEEA